MIHTASPFPLERPTDENVIIKPAVDGTLAALKGAKTHGIKRVVITSSCAAIDASEVLKENYSEEDWSVENSPIITPYYKSKMMAERAAWNFMDELPEDEKFELVTINPSLIMGPTKVADGFSSGKIL